MEELRSGRSASHASASRTGYGASRGAASQAGAGASAPLRRGELRVKYPAGLRVLVADTACETALACAQAFLRIGARVAAFSSDPAQADKLTRSLGLRFASPFADSASGPSATAQASEGDFAYSAAVAAETDSLIRAWRDLDIIVWQAPASDSSDNSDNCASSASLTAALKTWADHRNEFHCLNDYKGALILLENQPASPKTAPSHAEKLQAEGVAFPEGVAVFRVSAAMAEPEEIARLVLFLAHPTSAALTGLRLSRN